MPPVKTFPAFTPLVRMTVGNLVEMQGAELATLAAKEDGFFYNAEGLRLADSVDRLPPGNIWRIF